jgi:hypothetical protein
MAIAVAITALAAIGGLFLAPEEWPVIRKLLAGGMAGAFVAFCMVASRWMGAFDSDKGD